MLRNIFVRLVILVGTFVLLCKPLLADEHAKKLPILVYHQISVPGDGLEDGELTTPLAKFIQEMQYLHDHGYTTLNMDEVVQFIKGKSFPEKVVAIHFDDGWKTSKHALPVLEKFGFKATFWIIADVDDKDLGDTHMKWDEILELAKKPYIEIQSHTMTHPWKERDTLVEWVEDKTPGRNKNDAEWELNESKRLLEEKLGKPVSYLAWPAGYYNKTLVTMAKKAGYKALLTIDSGFNHPGDRLMYLKRDMVDGRCGLDVFQNILQEGVNKNCCPE